MPRVQGALARAFETAAKVVAAVETALVSVCLAGIVVVVVVQIFLRNFFDTGFLAGDPLVKHLLLWITFVGAGIAARTQSHLNVDVADRLLPKRLVRFKNALVYLFSAVVAALLARAGYLFVQMEIESRSTFGMTELPVWYFEAIIPIGLAVVALRFALRALRELLHKEQTV